MYDKQVRDITMGNQQESLSFDDLILVPELFGYYISKDGNIFSAKQKKYFKILKQYKHFGRSKNAYMRLKIAGKLMLSHRVIASIHIGRQLSFNEVVNHKNGITIDNRLENLEVLSQHENVAHAVKAKLYCFGSNWHKARGRQECKESSTTNSIPPER